MGGRFFFFSFFFRLDGAGVGLSFYFSITNVFHQVRLHGMKVSISPCNWLRIGLLSYHVDRLHWFFCSFFRKTKMYVWL